MINHRHYFVKYELFTAIICSKNFYCEYTREFIIRAISSKNFEIYLCKRVATKKNNNKK